MGWWIAVDSLLWIAAIILFFAGLGWWALGCAVAGILLTLVLSRGSVDFSDIFFFLD